MFTETRFVRGIVALAVGLVLFGAAPALAVTQTATGTWLSLRGTINVPLWFPTLGDTFNSQLLGLSRPEVPGFGLVNTTGSAPQTVTVPKGLYRDSRHQIIGVKKAFGGLGSLVQFETTFNFSAPATVGVLRQGPKTSRPASFAFCPGPAAANPTCTTAIIGGDQGTQLGLVAYTAGVNQFGGTMAIILGGNGTTSLSDGASPPVVSHQAVAVVGTQQAGGAYSNMASNTLQAGTRTTGFATTSTLGLITATGNRLGPGTSVMLTNTGFPMTTGMITIKIPDQAVPPAAPAPFTSTLTGSDARRPDGRGNIVLVAGGLSHRVGGPTFANIETVNLKIGTGSETPALLPFGMAAMVVLMLSAGGYVLRNRLA